LIVAGKLVRVSQESFDQYPTTARALDAGTCASISVQAAAGSRFIQTPDKKFFLVEGGKKLPLKNKAQYQSLKGTSPNAISVDNAFAARIPTGKAVKAGAPVVADAVSALPTPTASPAPNRPTPTPTVSPRPTASPTPSASPTPTPSPSPTASATKRYTIKEGDTLTRIASRFGTTLKKLMELNGITDPNRIRIGQVLKLP
jgi:LysM repeat protein